MERGLTKCEEISTRCQFQIWNYIVRKLEKHREVTDASRWMVVCLWKCRSAPHRRHFFRSGFHPKPQNKKLWQEKPCTLEPRIHIWSHLFSVRGWRRKTVVEILQWVRKHIPRSRNSVLKEIQGKRKGRTEKETVENLKTSVTKTVHLRLIVPLEPGLSLLPSDILTWEGWSAELFIG